MRSLLLFAALSLAACKDKGPKTEWVDPQSLQEGPIRGELLTQAAKNDVYSVVLLRSGAPDAEVLPRLKLTALTLDDAKEVLRLYKAAPVPISVTDAPP